LPVPPLRHLEKEVSDASGPRTGEAGCPAR
jgi:hypothetical protein